LQWLGTSCNRKEKEKESDGQRERALKKGREHAMARNKLQ
jgi:hypothetical protein